MTRRLLALACLPLFLGAAARAQDLVKLTLRTDPPVVTPGGWVDVIAAFDVTPGYCFFSPRSEKGTPAKLEVAGPEGWRRNSAPWVPEGKLLPHDVHGQVNALGGVAPLRWRYHVPPTAAAGKHEFQVALTVVVSDGKKDRPPQKLEGTTSTLVAETGARGPQLRNLDSQAALSEEELALLAKNGFVVRTRGEFDLARSQDVVCVPLDIVFQPDVREDAIQIYCEPVDGRFLPLPGWRAFHGEISLNVGERSEWVREVLPLSFWEQGQDADLKVPVSVTIRTVRGSDKASRMATQEVRVAIRYLH